MNQPKKKTAPTTEDILAKIVGMREQLSQGSDACSDVDLFAKSPNALKATPEALEELQRELMLLARDATAAAVAIYSPLRVRKFAEKP